MSTLPVTPNSSSAVTVADFNDPTAVGEDIEVIKQDVVQLEPKPLRVRRVVVRLGSSVVLFQSTNQHVRTRTVLSKGLVAFVAFGPRAAGTVNGLPVGPDRVLASAPGVEAEFVVAAGYESISFILPPDELQAHLGRPEREGEFRLPFGVGLMQTGAAASKLYAWGRRLTDTAVRLPEVFDRPRTKSVAQTKLVENLVATLGSAVDAEPAPHDLTRQAHTWIVQLAEDYVLTHPAASLYVTDLCRAAGVSERTLQYAFREVMGTTPVAYLTRLRLHRVRQALRAATHRTTTVSREAPRWGFWHLGDFSRAYQSCFGELPSHTLRHKPHAASRLDGRDTAV